MRYRLSAPSAIKATIQLPASKSISNRALIINALAEGNHTPDNLSDCDDTYVMIKALTDGEDIIDIMGCRNRYAFPDSLPECHAGRTNHHGYSTYAATSDTNIGQCAS